MGHKPADCPKDPNLRSKFDISREMDRLEGINKHRKANLSSGMMATQALSLLSEKSQVQEFHHTMVATSPVDSALYDSDEEEEISKDPNQFFSDIRKLRREIQSNQSKTAHPITSDSL